MTGEDIHFDAIEVGDDLSVTLRGKVEQISAVGSILFRGDGGVPHWCYHDEWGQGSIEKIVKHEPVITFEPGDLVRDRRFPSYQYAVLKDGSLASLAEGAIFNGPATSENYEKVN